MSVIFSPFESEKLNLNNRVLMAPMSRYYAPDNIPGPASVEYYRRRAEGGVGLIISEGTCINHIAASGFPNVPYFYGEQQLAGWKAIADAVHEAGGKMAPQLWHVGGSRKAGTPPEGDVPGYAPSGMNMPGRVTRHVMSEEDIADCIRAYAEGARDAQLCGFDAVELHGAHGYLIDQFLWDKTNVRNDHWGGTLEQRLRFAVEVVKACRAAVGDDFPILLRWSQWKQQDFTAQLAATPAELERLLGPLSDAGVDIFHSSTRRYWEPAFADSPLTLAGWVKKLLGKPSIAVGSIGLDTDFVPEPGSEQMRPGAPEGIDELERRMEAGEFDLCAVGRALIANPAWPNLIANKRSNDLQAFDPELLTELV